jgi:Tfp pilus assembly protein PilN
MNSIDFLPKRLRTQRLRHTRARRQGGVLAAALAVLALLAYLNHTRIVDLRATLRQRQGQQAALAQDLAVVPGLQTQLAEGSIKQRISRELGSRLAVNAVLSELGRLLPEKASLTGLQYSTVDIRRPGPSARNAGNAPVTAAEAGGRTGAVTEKRVRLVIDGITPDDLDVADFLGRLSASSLFSEVQMGFSKTVPLDENRREGRGFEVSCLLAH